MASDEAWTVVSKRRASRGSRSSGPRPEGAQGPVGCASAESSGWACAEVSGSAADERKVELPGWNVRGNWGNEGERECAPRKPGVKGKGRRGSGAGNEGESEESRVTARMEEARRMVRESPFYSKLRAHPLSAPSDTSSPPPTTPPSAAASARDHPPSSPTAPAHGHEGCAVDRGGKGEDCMEVGVRVEGEERERGKEGWERGKEGWEGVVVEVVVYGVGSIAHSPVARCQMALGLLLAHALQEDLSPLLQPPCPPLSSPPPPAPSTHSHRTSPPTQPAPPASPPSPVPQPHGAIPHACARPPRVRVGVFDPVLSPAELSALALLGVHCLPSNEEGRRTVVVPTLFYMPHCEAFLYNNVLEANASALGFSPNPPTSPLLLGESPAELPPSPTPAAAAAVDDACAGSMAGCAPVVILGNSFASYEERWSVGAQPSTPRPTTLLQAVQRGVVEEVPVDAAAFPLISAFNDTRHVLHSPHMPCTS
ncbi:unnamed protein product [Closterium sp. NIES-64]|nr:unnamed protein product [Closterium sp. NIES-64]